jgi:hypothetical protein
MGKDKTLRLHCSVCSHTERSSSSSRSIWCGPCVTLSLVQRAIHVQDACCSRFDTELSLLLLGVHAPTSLSSACLPLHSMHRERGRERE